MHELLEACGLCMQGEGGYTREGYSVFKSLLNQKLVHEAPGQLGLTA